MGQIAIKIEGLDQIQTRYKGAEDLIVRHFRASITKAAILLQAAARENAPVDRGFLRNSIVYQMSPLGAVIGSKAPYAEWAHEGRKPGSMPPVSILEDWARRHGMPGAGFAIARKIAARGTKGKPFFLDALAATEDRLAGLWQEAADNVIKDLS